MKGSYLELCRGFTLLDEQEESMSVHGGLGGGGFSDARKVASRLELLQVILSKEIRVKLNCKRGDKEGEVRGEEGSKEEEKWMNFEGTPRTINQRISSF